MLDYAAWRTRCRDNLADPHALHTVPKWLTIDPVTITQEIGGRGLVREGVHDLLSGPGSSGMFGDVEVDDPPAVVSEHDEDEQDAKASGGHGEEVDGDQVPDMVSEECPPGLRGLGAALIAGARPASGSFWRRLRQQDRAARIGAVPPAFPWPTSQAAVEAGGSSDALITMMKSADLRDRKDSPGGCRAGRDCPNRGCSSSGHAGSNPAR